METPKIHESEYRFCLILWEREPVTTSELVKLCQEQLGWKRTTTYTVLGRLAERGLFRNEGGQVTACLTRDEFYAHQSYQYVEDSFDGSLPAFLAAFTARKGLTSAEVEEIRRLIDSYEEG